MKTKNKYIDLNQFPHNKNGTISWKNSIGVRAHFMLNDLSHQIEILDRIDNSHIKIKLDDNFVKIVQPNEITNLSFEKIFYKPTYQYEIGDIVDDIKILEQTYIKHSKEGKYSNKAYKCCCLKDNYIFLISECDLNNGRRCPLCANKIIVKGINDIATTNPEMITYLKHKEDAYRYTAQSNKKIEVTCPVCGFTKSMYVYSLYKNGFSCDMCSDGISYPNKFAHELFRQLSNQYLEYEYEYSPCWANGYKYDNYVRLTNNKEIIIEMDGAYHYIDKWGHGNDDVKDSLAKKQNIFVVRVDCNYQSVDTRFEYIKNNVLNTLGDYFDLTQVDWEMCDLCGLSSLIINVSKYYKEHLKCTYDEISKYFGISATTVRSYIRIGSRLGLCDYVKYDANRIFVPNPIAVYDMNANLIGIYKSAKHIETSLSELELYKSSILRAIKKNKPYKGYLFKIVTYEEYKLFDDAKMANAVFQ